MKKLLLHLLYFLIWYFESTARCNPILNDEPSVCGYKSCPPVKSGFLNVHLIPHTHDDVGWLKTVDQYYFGSKPGIQKAGVQYILDSVVEELLRDKTKRFIYVETAFFWKWWKKQDDIRGHEVKRLVKNGQLEFIGGAWSMNDEADVNYQSVIDQFTWGFRKLNDSFGECGRPKIGWQIDPFGHSRETASIMARLGFDGLFFGRLDYREKTTRLSEKTAEMIWQGSPNNLGRKADLFTGVLFNNYGPPPTFCFDVLCDDEPIIDDKKSPDYNAESRAKQFINYVKLMSRSYLSNHTIVTMGDDFNYQDAHMWYKNMDKLIRFVRLQSQKYVTNNVIITMGGDFTYQDAHMWYKNMDKLIRVVNEMQINGSDVNLLYSTPSCYLKAVNDEDVTFSVKTDDFFPYASDPHSYWTGYFTSRPAIKFYERKGNNFLQICKQLYTLTDLGPEDRIDLDALRSAMGVMQHHDAITGTEKQHVAFDYARILSNGIAECETITDIALSKLMEKRPHVDEPKNAKQLLSLSTCPLLNISQCEVTENYDSFVITLYNPLSYPVTKYVRLPVPGNKPDYTILCPMGKQQVSQIVPIPESVQNIPGRFSQANYDLVFKAKHLPPLGFRSYYISKNKNHTNTDNSTNKSDNCQKARKLHKLNDKITISNDHLSFTINQADGHSKLTVDDEDIPLHQNFYFYKGAVGNNLASENRSSGAYIFRPNGTNAYPIGTVQRQVYKGPISVEVHETYSDWVSQIVRLYKNESYIEFNWLIGPIPIGDDIGKEVISRFTTNLTTKGTFYTDSNGREMLQRIRNYRPTWNLTFEEPISANYYPVTSKISIKDSKFQLSVLTDRAQGGSSINDGQIELMVHRRLLHDDAFGVGEALNETAFGKGLVVIGTHYLTAGNVNTQNAVERSLALEKLLDVWTFLTPAPVTSFDQWKQTYNMEYSGLTEALPQNVHVLTLEPWKGRSILIRLEHIFEVNEDNDFSKPVTVNLEKMFFPFTITSVQETTLGANQLLKDMERLKWKSESNSVYHGLEDDVRPPSEKLPPPPTRITLSPMEIRTFIVEVKHQ